MISILHRPTPTAILPMCYRIPFLPIAQIPPVAFSTVIRRLRVPLLGLSAIALLSLLSLPVGRLSAGAMAAGSIVGGVVGWVITRRHN